MWHLVISLCVLLSSSLEGGESITGNDSSYLESCRKATSDPLFFERFRASPGYTHALEVGNGTAFAGYILQRASQDVFLHLHELQRLEDFGSPATSYYPHLGCFSGTTLRYIVIAEDIKEMFSLPQKPKIVEIGAGFGGQCYILSHLFPFSKYYIYDLPEVEGLINKMMKALSVRGVICLPIAEELPDEKIDLLISNYAYSECDRKTQLDYFARVLKRADRGYITYNQIARRVYGLDSLTPDEFISLLEEQGIKPKIYTEPIMTGEDNLLIVWDKTR